MSFRTALKRFNNNQKGELEKRFSTLSGASATGRQVEQNLWNEQRLPATSAKVILDALLSESNDESLLKESYVYECRKHILEGPEMKGPRPGLLGRAVTPKAFYEMLVLANRYSSINSARAAIRRLMRLPADETASRMRRTPLGRYLMWGTYNIDNRYGNPFDALPDSADEIRDHLGLNPAEKGKPIFLFVYEPSPSIELRFPTVADAQWHYHFRPTPDYPDMESGLTLPLKEDLPPQPEVVHKPVNGDTLRRSIEECPP